MNEKELKNHVADIHQEDEKNREIEKDIREEADKVEVPEALRPEQIEVMLLEHTDKKMEANLHCNCSGVLCACSWRNCVGNSKK